jgi:hypothetical protein
MVETGRHQNGHDLDPEADYMKATVRLSCHYSGSPGTDWNAMLEAREHRDRIEIWEGFGEFKKLRLTNKLPPGDVCEGLLRFLEDHDEIYCLPSEALSAIVVEGVSGYVKELIALYWCRWGDEKEINYCRDFSSLSGPILEDLKKFYGSLVRSSSKDRWFLRDFEKLVALRADLNLEELPIGKLITTSDLEAGEGLRPTLQKLQAKWDEVSNEETSEVARQIEELVSLLSQNWPRPKSFVTGMHFAGKQEKLRNFIRAYYLQHRRLPVGDFKVAEDERVTFTDSFEKSDGSSASSTS